MRTNSNVRREFLTLASALILLALAVPASAGTLYTNGPIKGSDDAATINFGFSVSDSFTLLTTSALGGVDFGVWLLPGDTVSSVDWAIGTSAFDNSMGHGKGIVSGTFQFTNAYGYNIYSDSFDLPGLDLAAGSYYLTLQNASAGGDPVYWDENEGPSAAYQSSGGPGIKIDSESFDIRSAVVATPEPGTMILLGSFFGLGGLLRRRQRCR